MKEGEPRKIVLHVLWMKLVAGTGVFFERVVDLGHAMLRVTP